jgi:hypothetical protein
MASTFLVAALNASRISEFMVKILSKGPQGGPGLREEKRD